MTHTLESDGLDTRTRRAKRHWEEAWSNPIEAKRNWQRFALGELVILLCAVFWIGYLGRLPKQVLYVLERDKAGSVSYAGPVKPVDMDTQTWQIVKVQSLKKFVEYWRTVTADRTAEELNYNRAFMYIGDGSTAKAALTDWFNGNNPFQRAQNGEIVTVQYKTFDVEGQHTFGLWWEETTRSQGGQVVSRKAWRARMVYDLHIPTSESAREENSLGILITELSWQEVQ